MPGNAYDGLQIHMTDTRRYILVWFAAVFIGLNGGAVASVVALYIVDSWLHLTGMPRTIVLWAAFGLASVAVTVAVGKALVRLVAKQLNESPPES